MKQIIEAMEVRIKDLFDTEILCHSNGDYTNYAITKQVRVELIDWRNKLIARTEER